MRRPSAVRRDVVACAFLLGALAAMVFCGMLIVGASDGIEQVRSDAYEDGMSDATNRQQAIVSDRPLPEGNHMPLWLQGDPQWSSLPYAGGTIGDSGCGLVCSAMAIKYMTLQDVTPIQLADAVGDDCLTDGVNDPAKFCGYIEKNYPEYRIERADRRWAVEDALKLVDDGWLAFAGLSGRLGDREYSGHVVLIWRSDDAGYWIRDPASAGNSARPFTKDELKQVSFRYFDFIKGGLYGNAGS